MGLLTTDTLPFKLRPKATRCIQHAFLQSTAKRESIPSGSSGTHFSTIGRKGREGGFLSLDRLCQAKKLVVSHLHQGPLFKCRLPINK